MSGQQVEPGGQEVPIEREGGRDSLAPHQLEAHRVGQGEALVAEAVQPMRNCVEHEIRPGPEPLVGRILEHCPEVLARRGGTSAAQQVTVELGEDERRPDPAPSSGEKPPADRDGICVMLIARVCHGKQGARINEDAGGHASSALS